MALVQAFYLFKNRQNLAKDLKVDDVMLKMLEGRGVLLETDLAHLDNVKSLGNDPWVEELLRIVAFRRDGYDNLVDVLTQMEQYEVVVQLTDGLHQEFQEEEEGIACKRPRTDYDDGSTRETGEKKVSRRRLTKRMLKSWRIPFGECLEGMEEDTDEDDGNGTSNANNEVTPYTPKSIPVPLTKAHYYFTHDSVLGQGRISTVYSGYWDNDQDCKVAVKSIHKNKATISSQDIALVKDGLPKVNFVSVLDWSRVDDAYYIVTELALCTLAHGIISNFKNLNGDKRRVFQLLEQCTEGLCWLHKDKNVTHGNIKPQNILLFEENGSQLVAKLGDFGICRKFEGKCDEGDKWMSPEQLVALENQVIFENAKSMDIFSFGLLFHFALSGGDHPFEVVKDMMVVKNVKDQNFMPLPLEMGVHFRFPTAQNLISWMLQKEPERRPEVSQVKTHPIFWEELKCLGFLENVMKCLSDNKCMEIRQKIDEMYGKFNPEFDWMPLVDERLFEGKGTKKYDSGSLMSLVEFLRDKAELYLEVELDHNVLPEGMPLNRKSYAEYFMPLFPELVVTLFCWLSRAVSSYEGLGVLKKEYFGEYEQEGGENCWED